MWHLVNAGSNILLLLSSLTGVGVFYLHMLILDQELRATSDLNAFSLFTFYLVKMAVSQANTAEIEEML